MPFSQSSPPPIINGSLYVPRLAYSLSLHHPILIPLWKTPFRFFQRYFIRVVGESFNRIDFVFCERVRPQKNAIQFLYGVRLSVDALPSGYYFPNLVSVPGKRNPCKMGWNCICAFGIVLLSDRHTTAVRLCFNLERAFQASALQRGTGSSSKK